MAQAPPLSALPDAHPALGAPQLLLDVCQLGFVLRALLGVELALGTGALYGSVGFAHWLERLALLSVGALPATLIWLLVVCAAKRWLVRLARPIQGVLVVGLGAFVGWYGCALVYWTSALIEAPWLASAATGALLAGVLVAQLFMRARGRLPADTLARLAGLQARIRPHFLFNTLNSAIALVRLEPQAAEALLEDLSELFRYALRDGGEAVTLQEEIDLARRYLAIEQVRFGERLRVAWDLDAQAGVARLPPLLLQPLVENAVRHGVEPSVGGADIQISTLRRASTVVIRVVNTVPAGAGLPGAGVALHNVRQRLGLLHDIEGRFQSGLKNGVYQVRMEVPL